MIKAIPESVIEYSNNLGSTTLGADGAKESVTITPNAEFKAAVEDIRLEGAHDPWTMADKKGDPLLTPMDNKTIKNAIMKRLPEARQINLVGVEGIPGRMKIVVVCEANYPGETAAILIEDNANVFMRHRELMNIVDNMYWELRARKRLRKTNKLPAHFLRSNEGIDLSRHTK